jgi:DivIVA domain-containing protein
MTLAAVLPSSIGTILAAGSSPLPQILVGVVLVAALGWRLVGPRLLHRPQAPGKMGPHLTASAIRKTKFSEKLRGYHPRDVDQFLAQVADRIDAGLPVAEMARDVKFREKLRGYRPDEVDALLSRLASQ